MSESPRWLLLAYQLASKSSNGRVTTWRRLQQLGAVQARNSVYVLPNTTEAREDFEWIRSEIVSLQGEATVFAADAISEGAGEDLVALFEKSRAGDYHVLKREVDRALTAARRKRHVSPATRQQLSRSARVLGNRLNAIEHIDFFHSVEREKTAAALAALEQVVEGNAEANVSRAASLRAADFSGRTWTTRPRPGVDRMASAWLIRRFIDPNATFVFADEPRESDVPFDMYSGEFSHHGSLCTFEVLTERFGLANSFVARVGQIVHDLDMKETKYAPPEAPTIGRMVEGLRAVHADDQQLLEQGIGMFEALARSFASTDTSALSPSRRRLDRRRTTGDGRTKRRRSS